MFRIITDWRAKRQADRLTKEQYLAARMEKEKICGFIYELGIVSQKVLVNGMQAYCDDPRELSVTFELEGSYIHVDSRLNKDRRKITHIRVYCPDMGIMLTETFSHKAVLICQEVSVEDLKTCAPAQ